jgi:hypothetical protein
MKNVMLLLVMLSFTSTAMAQESWWDSLLNAVGLGEETTEQVGPSVDGLLESVTSNLGVTKEQAQGGIAALVNYAKQNVSEEQFAALSAQIPGLDSVMEYLPEIKAASEGGLGGLMDKAAQYKQFESLGLNTGMIKDYASQAKAYLDTPEGQEAKTLLTDGLLKI